MRAAWLCLLVFAACSGGREMLIDPLGPVEAGPPPDSGPVPPRCVEGALSCSGQDVMRCDAAGNVLPTGVSCDPAAGELCSLGACVSACEQAAQAKSYIGCEYWPTTTLNAVSQFDFSFAVAVANPHDVTVRVQVTRGDAVMEERNVAPGDLATIELPWIPELSSYPAAGAFGGNALVEDGAYRLTSSLPVTVYQFSPLEYESGPGEYSYSNDASLLLPTSALGTEYRAIARSSGTLGPSREWLAEENVYAAPGFLAIVATEDGTTVRVLSKSKTAAGPNGAAALRPGDEGTYRLNRGDVLEIVSNSRIYDDAECMIPPPEEGTGGCTGGRANDLTGSSVIADKPIAAFGGHYCTHIPAHWLFCDHVEEQLTPLPTWGTSALAITTAPQVPGETNFFRVVSGSQANEVTFDPPVHEPVVLADGEFFEFEHEGALRVRGSGRLQLVQFTVGGQHSARWPGSSDQLPGDPSMGLVAPTEQYRGEYTFLSPRTFDQNYVNVIAPIGATLTLDDGPVPTLETIDGTGFGWARVPISSGVHRMSGGSPFGIMIYGVAPACSYLYPGGLDLLPLLI